jgi:hypothetical protein
MRLTHRRRITRRILKALRAEVKRRPAARTKRRSVAVPTWPRYAETRREFVLAQPGANSAPVPRKGQRRSFGLTPREEQLRPVLEDLVRWGLPLMTEQDPGAAVRSHWLVWALELMLADCQPDACPVTLEGHCCFALCCERLGRHD